MRLAYLNCCARPKNYARPTSIYIDVVTEARLNQHPGRFAFKTRKKCTHSINHQVCGLIGMWGSTQKAKGNHEKKASIQPIIKCPAQYVCKGGRSMQKATSNPYPGGQIRASNPPPPTTAFPKNVLGRNRRPMDICIPRNTYLYISK